MSTSANRLAAYGRLGLVLRAGHKRFFRVTLAEGVKKYLELAGEFGRPVALALLGLSRAETEELVSTWDEDYQINRYMLLTLEAAGDPARASQIFLINGFECSHITFQSDIEKLL